MCHVAARTTAGTTGYTPLHYAARAGRLEAVQLLLKHGTVPIRFITIQQHTQN